MAEPNFSNVDSPGSSDKEFEPSADMLVHDYDDENTLDEEENLSNSDAANELDELQKESDMPIEELLALYGCGATANHEIHHESSSSEEDILSNHDLTLDKEEVARDLLQEDSDEETTERDLLDSVDSADFRCHTARLLRSDVPGQDLDGSDTSEDDDDYEPNAEPDWKKAVQVGVDFQAEIPGLLTDMQEYSMVESNDRLVWDPSRMEETKVVEYLRQVQQPPKSSITPDQAASSIRLPSDDEQALYLLEQCDYNVDEALRRHFMHAVKPSDPMSLWSEEECRNFENGLKMYGKDFFAIQQKMVRTRTTGDLVQFYYLWKKTERHDAFVTKNRLEKRKYTLNPGTTDFMDRFIDEQESHPLQRDRPSSPIHSLLFGDHKRHMESPSKTPTHEEMAAVLEMVNKAVDPGTLNELVPNLHSHLVARGGGASQLDYLGESPLTQYFKPIEIETVKDTGHSSDVSEGSPAKRPRVCSPNQCNSCGKNEKGTLLSTFSADEISRVYTTQMDQSSAFSSRSLSNDTGIGFGREYSPQASDSHSVVKETCAH